MILDILKSIPSSILEDYEKATEVEEEEKEERKFVVKQERKERKKYFIGTAYKEQGWVVVILGEKEGKERWEGVKFVEVARGLKMKNLEQLLWNRIRHFV